MKKGFGKKIIFFGIGLIFNVVSVKAACSLEMANPTQDGQTQASNDCNLMIYCIGHGKPNIHSTNECTVEKIVSPALNTIQSIDNEGAKVAAYRIWTSGTSLNNGIEGVTYDKLSDAGKAAYNTASKLSTNYTLVSINGSSNINAQIINSTSSSGRYNAEVQVTANTTITDIRISSGNRINSKNCNGSACTISISGNIEECKGASPTIYVYGNISGTPATPGTPGTPSTPGTPGVDGTPEWYYFKCPGKQNYIGYTTDANTKAKLIPGTSGTDGTPGTPGTPETPGTGFIGSASINIPDKDCNCSGTTTMTGKCDTNGKVRDLEDENNLKSCIKSGGFASYCNTNLQKKTDNNKNADGDTLSRTKPGSSVTLADNNYCKVYCLEKIDFNLPGTINTDNGSYFKLKKDWNKLNDSGTNMSIKGTRTCYTSEIKKSDFIAKVKELQLSIRDSWNEYQKNKKKEEIYENQTHYAKSGTKNCTYPTTEVQYVKDAKGNPVKNADGTYKTTTVNTTGTKPNPYTYYEATNVSYPYEKGTPNWDGTWNSKLGTDTVSLTWGNNPTCNADGTITEDTAKPEITLTTNYASLLQNLASEIQKYKSCTEWNNNYCFDPDISFSYDEVYNDLVSGKIDKTVTEISNETTHYTSVDNEYKNGDKIDGEKTVQKYIYVDETTSSDQTSNIDLNTIYMKQEVVKEATYKDATKEIYTYHPFGTIVIDKNTVEKKENLRSLGYAFPIALQHDPDTGIYNYYLAISNIGVGGDDAGECRYTNKIIGDSCSIFNTKTEAETGKEYVCQYKTKKCPECEVECVCPDGSTNCYVENKVCKFKECEDCKVECIGTCVWNDGDTTISYKTISLDDVYQDDTQIGGNWTEEDVKAIQDKGQTIYENKPVFKIELTPSLMNKIRQYNEDNKEYSNDTLSCSNKNSSGEYYCTSSFLKDFLSKQHANYTDFDRK